jgi:predicted alpha-1,6-mannanase (GH76 family)
MIVEKKQQQQIFEVRVTKTDYFYLNVKANSADEAEDIVIDLGLTNLQDYWDDVEWEVVALERTKTHIEGVETIN